jgi:hypothetical protein
MFSHFRENSDMKLYSIAVWTLAFGLTTLPGVASTAQVFAGGASSTGWINFDFQDGKRIFIPVKINGHETEALLATGLPVSDIDKTFAASIGLERKEGSDAQATKSDDTTGLIHGVQIQIGNLTFEDTSASPVDFAPLAKHIGHSLPLLLGDDAFNELSVDIDFAHHRIAFSTPASQTKPDGATEIPLTRFEDIPLVPVSIEDAAPAQFELGLGNSSDVLVYQSYYDAHHLLDGRRASKRLAAGTGGVLVEPVATLSRAEFAGLTFRSVPAAFIPASQTGTKSDVIAGDLGLPILSRFRLIIDYSHNRLYAVPYGDVTRAPLSKDRLGLFVTKEDADFAVKFVAPNSPAEAAGFKAGDKIAMIDGKPAQAWPETAFADLRYGASGTPLAFTMQGGARRRVKLADYF